MYNLLSCKINVHLESEFDGDTNTQLINLQRTFDIWSFIGYYASQFIDACDLVGKHDIAYYQVQAKSSANTDLFLRAYRTICAYYRFISQTQNMPLLKSDSVYISLLKSNWEMFYHGEMRSLARDPHINQTVIFMLVRDNDEVANYAESILLKLLTHKYAGSHDPAGEKFLTACPQFQIFSDFEETAHKEWPYGFWSRHY